MQSEIPTVPDAQTQKKSAQKYQRVDTSPSPIILKERVSDDPAPLGAATLEIPVCLSFCEYPLKIELCNAYLQFCKM